MPRSPEQQDTDNALDAAISASATADGNVPDGAVITDWVVVYVGLYTDDDGDDCVRYGMAFPGGSAPAYRPVGLLNFGIDMLSGGWLPDDEETP